MAFAPEIVPTGVKAPPRQGDILLRGVERPVGRRERLVEEERCAGPPVQVVLEKLHRAVADGVGVVEAFAQLLDGIVVQGQGLWLEVAARARDRSEVAVEPALKRPVVFRPVGLDEAP